jgi:spore maturation protein CgeB
MSHRFNISFFGSSLVSAHQNYPVGYYRGLVRALSERGHRVTFYEPDDGERLKLRDIPNPHWAKVVVYPATDESALDALERAEQSDLIIKCSGVGVCDDLLEAAVLELKKPETLVAFLDVNAPATLDRINADPEDSFRPLIPEYDFILTRGGGAPVVEAYLAAGASECIPIYNALDPNLHFPVPSEKRFEADLGLLNDHIPEREARVKEFFFKPAASLPDCKLLLGGAGWRKESLPSNVECLGVISADEQNAFNCTPRAILNINCGCATRYGFSPPSRVFEAAGAGACLITDKWEGIEFFLEPDREVLVAANGEEVAEQLRRLTPERARQIGQAAHARVIAAHTYSQRAEQLEKVLEAKAGRVIA